MDLSTDWRSPWTISSSFSTPSLVYGPSSSSSSSSSAAASIHGPLLFYPSRPHRTLLSSPSLFPRLPPPTYSSSAFYHDLKAFFHSCHGDFAPPSFQYQLLDSLLPDLHTFPASPHPKDPILPNLLLALPSRHPGTLFLFFPVGDNADHLGYLGLSLDWGEVSGTVLDPDGDMFLQQEGFRHRHHRFIQLAVHAAATAAAAAADGEETSDRVEGHLLAVTLYSVSWFQVESDPLGPTAGKRRPVLAPMMKQGFKERVVHACWNPHFAEESAVLLESGKAVLVDQCARNGVAFDVSAGGKLGELLSCEFGGRPWNLIVAGSSCVVSFDLRSRDGGEPVVLARIDLSDVYRVVHSMEDDCIVAFCKAEFDCLYFSVVTRYHVFLFDMRCLECPLLSWDHGIGNPTYVEMLKLSDLRSVGCTNGDPCSDGYAILVASLWEDMYKLFCYGRNGKEDFGGSSFCAWELPFRVSFSGRDHCSADGALREDFFKGGPPRWVDWQEKKDLVTGFYICPRSYVSSQRGSEETDGFELIRLMSSGKLEVQRYCATWDRLNEKPGCEGPFQAKADVSLFHHWKEVDMQVRQPRTVKLDLVTAYMNGDLLEALAKVLDECQDYGVKKGIYYNSVLWQIIESKISYFASKSIADVTFPASLHDIATRRVLVTSSSSLLYLSFSRYRDLFGADHKFSIEFFEVPNVLANRRVPPLLTGKPSRRATRWSRIVRPGNALICPTLPPPVILALEWISNDRASSSRGTESDEYLLGDQCDKVRRHFFPEISLASNFDFNDHDSSMVPEDENSFFTLEVLGATCVHSIEYCTHDKHSSFLPQPEKNAGALGPFEDQNLTTFIVGAHDIRHVKPLERENILDLFDDLVVIKLDFASPGIKFSLDEERAYRSLGKQHLKWQGRYSQYQDFCLSKKISSGIL